MEWFQPHWCIWWRLRGQSDTDWLELSCHWVQTCGTLPWKQTCYLFWYSLSSHDKQEKKEHSADEILNLQMDSRSIWIIYFLKLFFKRKTNLVWSSAGDVFTQRCGFTASPTVGPCNYFSPRCHLHYRLLYKSTLLRSVQFVTSSASANSCLTAAAVAFIIIMVLIVFVIITVVLIHIHYSPSGGSDMGGLRQYMW